MDPATQDQWTKALSSLTARKSSKTETPSMELAHATEVVTKVMYPSLDAAPKNLRVKGSLNVLLRKGLGRWIGDWMLDTYRKAALEDLVPRLEEIDSQYQEHLASGLANEESAQWILPKFSQLIDAIHRRLFVSRQLTLIFDTQVRTMDNDPTLQVSSRFMADFSAELAIRLPPSFDQIAHLYFRTNFRQFEILQSQMSSSADITRLQWDGAGGSDMMDTAAPNDQYGSDMIKTSIVGQRLSKKRRHVMQDGRFAMDLFGDDKNDAIVEQYSQEVLDQPGIQESEELTSRVGPYLDLCQKLEEIGFASRMTHVVTGMLYEEVSGKIFKSFKKNWAVATLAHGKKWMEDIILRFLHFTLLPKKDQEDLTASKRFKMWASRLEFYFFKTFGDLRISEFFDIIVECPESTPAVNDLKTCVEWTGQREQLQISILAAMDKRLLHPGAETKNIIEFYIYAIKYLRIMDPLGVMLDRTARQINKYLRTRDDTMRAIVSCIVDDSSDLLTNSNEGIPGAIEADNDGSDDENWVPEPVHAGPDLSSARRKMADIISVLASIYDTNDRFIDEFQAILADRLLQATDFNVDREIRQLELLKLRFGDTDLHHCEVMLADIAESKRVNSNIQSLRPQMTVSTTIASRYYWPEIEAEEEGEFELPTPLQEMLDSYNAAFEITKPAQKLKVFPALGMVDLELELDGRSISMQVQPIYAAIIYLFEDHDRWTLSDMASKIGVREETLESKIQFWMREGILRETSRHQYELNEQGHNLKEALG
ncbi:Anaphase-promoting complex subunit 2 [Linnemannia schmuckeri]|uniref:Anaphase-promoting complex subunit 2 n=1 Tax=Linnemannia schmuckeri TaxID=64567 RepID=A0A9P5RB83_9FUNG|nr:Anaphase-promoting complex subunit 2 [Linnemannia schmuckeri]